MPAQYKIKKAAEKAQAAKRPLLGIKYLPQKGQEYGAN
jgi:hypothetical protein